VYFCSLHFQSINQQLYDSSEDIVSIQRDSYRRGRILFANSKAVGNFKFGENVPRYIYGNHFSTDKPIDGVTADARFKQIVDMVQPEFHRLYILETHCIRHANRRSGIVATLVGKCANAGYVNGAFGQTQFTQILSGVLLTATTLVISEFVDKHVLRIVNFATNTTSLIGACPGCKNIFTNNLRNKLFTFANRLVEIDLATGQSLEVIGNRVANHTVDGTLQSSGYNDIYDAFWFSNEMLIATDHIDHVVRLYNIKEDEVTSLCGATKLVNIATPSFKNTANFFTCYLQGLRTVMMLPETGNMILGGKNFIVSVQTAFYQSSKCLTYFTLFFVCLLTKPMSGKSGIGNHCTKTNSTGNDSTGNNNRNGKVGKTGTILISGFGLGDWRFRMEGLGLGWGFEKI